MIKAIETKYKGRLFRSRIEARWAVFFDSLGLKWEYEPEGFDIDGVWYLPDFKVYYPDSVEWFEVKGNLESITEKECKKIYSFSKHNPITILDGEPAATVYMNINSSEFNSLSQVIDELKFFGGLPITSRSGFALWSGKSRMWWDDHSNFFSPTTYFGTSTEIEDAVEKALSERFEKIGDKKNNGKKVHHPVFGIGFIQSRGIKDGQGNNLVTIRFNHPFGVKTVVENYCRLIYLE